MIVTHPGADAVLQLFEYDRGNPRHIKLAGLRDRQPDQLNEFFIGTDKAVIAARDRRDIGGEEPAVEPPRPPRRRNRAGGKEDGAEGGDEPCFWKSLATARAAHAWFPASARRA